MSYRTTTEEILDAILIELRAIRAELMLRQAASAPLYVVEPPRDLYHMTSSSYSEPRVVAPDISTTPHAHPFD